MSSVRQSPPKDAFEKCSHPKDMRHQQFIWAGDTPFEVECCLLCEQGKLAPSYLNGNARGSWLKKDGKQWQPMKLNLAGRNE